MVASCIAVTQRPAPRLCFGMILFLAASICLDQICLISLVVRDSCLFPVHLVLCFLLWWISWPQLLAQSFTSHAVTWHLTTSNSCYLLRLWLFFFFFSHKHWYICSPGFYFYIYSVSGPLLFMHSYKFLTYNSLPPSTFNPFVVLD